METSAADLHSEASWRNALTQGARAVLGAGRHPDGRPAYVAASWPATATAAHGLDDDLVAAAGRGDAAEVRRLLAAGARADARQRTCDGCGDGHTALIEAVRLGRVEAARALIEAGADVHARGQRGYNPAEEALQQGAGVDAILLVLDRVEDVPDYLGPHALRLALECHNDPRLAELVLRFRPRDVMGDNVTTPLHWVMHCARPDLAALLLERGADVHRRDSYGRTALGELLDYLRYFGKGIWYPGFSGVAETLISAGLTAEEARELLPLARELLDAQEAYDALDGVRSANARFYRRLLEMLETHF